MHEQRLRDDTSSFTAMPVCSVLSKWSHIRVRLRPGHAARVVRAGVRRWGMAKDPQREGPWSRFGPIAVLRGGQARARKLGAGARSRGVDGLEWSLDRIFDEPFDVPDAKTALRLLSGEARPPTGALARYLEGQALVRITAQVAKVASRSRAARAAAGIAAFPAATSETGATAAAASSGGAAMSTATSMGAAALAAAAVAATTRTTRTVRRGLNDLRVLASFLMSRAREQRVSLDKSRLRAVTIAIYIDPRRRADLRFSGSRGAAAVLGRWSRDATSNPGEARRRDLTTAWVDAIDRLDVATVANDRSHGSTGCS